jgi:poly(3-hydroxybutyrate) depolymerase
MSNQKNLKSFAFQNKYGWMNAMKGSKWKSLLKDYQKDYEEHLSSVKNSTLAKQFEQELQQQPSYTQPTHLDSILYEMVGGQNLRWRMETDDTDVFYYAADIDVDGNRVWSVEDTSEGSEQYTLRSFEKGARKWSYDKAVGPFVAVVGNRCYAIEVKNYLWLHRLISVDVKSGKDRRVELELKDPKWNLQLVKGERGSLFFVANNAGVQRCWYRTVKGAVKEIEGYEAFVPVTVTGGEPCYFGRVVGADRYEAVNCQGMFPSFQTQVPETYLQSQHLLITRNKGLRTVWDTKKGKSLFTVVANIDVDSLPAWKGGDAIITLNKPGAYRQTLDAYLTKTTVCPYASTKRLFAKSIDGTRIPYITVSSCKPKHLLCLVYGAYGVPTRLTTDRWKPLLDRGWGLCFALVRGGGDHTDAWAEAARRENKVKSVEDFEACIRAAQKEFHVGPGQTFLYGRSAGGYTVGATLARHPSGNLFTGIYTEVPYVDVLNTTSNPTLPLTKLEYNEFGDPHRLPNAQTLVSLSPIDALPSGGAPSIFVLTRTASNDKEVYAYESVKWITRLRDLQDAKGEPKLLAFTEKEGHFAPAGRSGNERANDMAIFHSWLASHKKSHEGIYQMATRRNNASRKRRNNVSMRKRRNNVTMGGKRRKAAGTRRRRGGRR